MSVLNCNPDPYIASNAKSQSRADDPSDDPCNTMSSAMAGIGSRPKRQHKVSPEPRDADLHFL